jgi:hypothetical protein
VSALFQPDAVLPAQWQSVYATDALTPEAALLRAILCDALNCVTRHGTPQRDRESREALAWIHTHDEDWPASFERICDVLHLEPAAVRVAVVQQSIGPQTVSICPRGRGVGRRVDGRHRLR